MFMFFFSIFFFIGGETNFPDLGIAVTPKKGRALLWPSTLDSDPTRIDIRTMHEVRTVRTGRVCTYITILNAKYQATSFHVC